MKTKLSRFAVPYVVWMAIFVVAPIVIMVIYAFSNGEGGATLDNFVQMGGYAAVFGRSFKLALIATAICLLIGYPVAYLLSREGASFQRTAMVLIMLPMWMNFLLRTYSWMTILENHGLLNQLLQKIGILALYNHLTGSELEYFTLINTQGAVVLGMVYNYLPFMILPIYSVIIKLDHSLLEAARDLGANSLTVFRKVVLPLSLPVLATFGLFYAVGHWNAYFGAMIYMPGAREKWPLQVLLREIVFVGSEEEARRRNPDARVKRAYARRDKDGLVTAVTFRKDGESKTLLLRLDDEAAEFLKNAVKNR